MKASGAIRETAPLSLHRHPADSPVVKPDRRIRSASVTMNVEGRRKPLRIRAASSDT